MKEFITVCPRNCYSTCTFRVRVENNTIKSILPYTGNHSTPEGPCIKGLSYMERASSHDRIRHPLLRMPDGSFKTISATEALEIIATKLSAARSKYGPASIFWYRGSGISGLVNEIGYSFWKLFGGTTITYGNLCWPAGLEAVKLTLGSVKHNVPWDISNASAIIIWGKNPAETNIQEMAFIDKARKKGARIIVIDPRITPTADKADILFRPKPGTDGALAMAIAGVLIKERLVDYHFIEEHVSGFEEFRQISPIPAANAERITGIPENEIIRLARLIGNIKPVTFLPGYGLQRYQNGGETVRSILSLAVLTGNIGKKGAGFNYANLQSYVFDDPKEPDSYYPDPHKDHPFRRSISMARLGKDILDTNDPEIKIIWVERGNPVLQAPDTNSVVKAFKQSEFTVVVDQFMTDTALLADIVLPAKDIFEQSDIVGSYWSPYVQFKPKILEPMGEIMPESEIYYHLARLMDIIVTNDTIPEPGNENIEKWLENRIASYPGLSINDLMEGPVIPPDNQEIAFSDYKFSTPTGKIELRSELFTSKWGISPVPEYKNISRNSDEEKKHPLQFMSPNTGSRIHSQFGNLELIKLNSEEMHAEISPEDAERRNLKTGDTVEMFNDNGTVECRIRVTDRIPEGLAVLPNGVWFSEGGGGNRLTRARETDIGYGAAFHGNLIEIRKK